MLCGNWYNTSLQEVNFGNGVEEIRYQAFGNTSLTEINLPSSLKNVSTHAFYNSPIANYTTYQNANYLGTETNPYMMLMDVTSTSITSLEIHQDCEYILTGAIKNCANLENLILPDGIKAIGKNAFDGCTKLLEAGKDGNYIYLGTASNSKYALIDYDTSATITTVNDINSNTKILIDGAFEKLNTLESITIPEYITRIGNCMFNGCTSLTTINFAHVAEIEESAFASCSSLTSIDIPQAVNYLWYATFAKCTSLNNIVIHENLKYITGGTFSSCTELKNVTILSEEIYNNLFSVADCGQLVNFATEVKVLASIVDADVYKDNWLNNTEFWSKTLSTDGNYYIFKYIQ